MSSSHIPTKMDTAAASTTTPKLTMITSILTGLLALPGEIRLQIYREIISTSPIMQTIQILDTFKNIGSCSWPDTQDTFYAILPTDFHGTLYVAPAIASELTHLFQQPISMTEDKMSSIKMIHIHHDSSAAGDKKIVSWLRLRKFMQKRATIIPLSIVYHLESADGVDHRVTYKFTAHALQEKAGFNSLFVQSDPDDSDSAFFFSRRIPGKPEVSVPKWCLQRATEALGAYVSSSESKRAGWTVLPLDTAKPLFYTGRF